jgi:hypothetical protein
VANVPRPPAEAAQAVATIAALADGRHRNHRERGRRPVLLKLDVGLSIELPGPTVLAEIVFPVLNAGRDLRNDHGALVDLAGPEPAAVGLAEHVEAVRTFVATLPEDTAAGRPYKDLRLFVAQAEPGNVSAYVTNVARAVRRIAPPVPAPVRSSSERLTPEQREANYRASQRQYAQRVRDEIRVNQAEDNERAAAWLLYVQETNGPGVVVPARGLCVTYVNACGTKYEPVGRNTFFQIADVAVGPRTRRRINGKPQPAYVTQEVPQMTREERKDLARLIVAKIAEDWKADARAGLADLVADERALASAVNDALRTDNVIPLRTAV